MDWTEETKKAQDKIKKGADELKKKGEELIDEATKKAQEALDKAKQALTPENIQRIKEIDKWIKETVPNLISELPGPAQKVLEKLDKLIEKLDPPEDDPVEAGKHASALRGLMDEHLKPFIDEIGQQAKQEFSFNVRRLELTYDLLLLLEAEAEHLTKSGEEGEQATLRQLLALGSEKGTCYSTRTCAEGSVQERNVTAAYCWQHGGKAWKDSSGKCHHFR
jgi:hypothetical protein